MMSSQDNTIKPKHLAISYKPKSYTDADFIIPPEMCLTETEKLEYILADVPQEIWTNIWEFKLIAEKRQMKKCDDKIEWQRENWGKQLKIVEDNFKNYNVDKHIYFNYQRMAMVWNTQMDDDVKQIFIGNLKENCQQGFGYGNLEKYINHFHQSKQKAGQSAITAFPPSYEKMTIQQYVKNTMKKSNVSWWEQIFFNWLMIEFVKWNEKRGYGDGCDTASMSEIGRKHYFINKQHQEVLTFNERKLDEWIKYKKYFQDKIIDMYGLYPAYAFQTTWGGGERNAYTLGVIDNWIKSPSPHFYKKERSCLAGIDCGSF